MKEIPKKLHVQVFLRMNTWMFETCRRQYTLYFYTIYINISFMHPYQQDVLDTQVRPVDMDA